jgi:hypothetical protein
LTRGKIGHVLRRYLRYGENSFVLLRPVKAISREFFHDPPITTDHEIEIGLLSSVLSPVRTEGRH